MAAACPSPRDQRIYFEVRILGTTQLRTAGLFGLTQPRVSQIVREVARWHAEQGVEPPDEIAARRRRLADRDECERLRNLYELTLAELERQNVPEVARKFGRRGYVEWDEESHCPPRGRVQLLKLARNLVHDLHAIEPCVSGPADEADDAAAGIGIEESVIGTEAAYAPAPEVAEPASEEVPVAVGEAAASEAPADSCEPAVDHKSNGHTDGESRKNGANINWPGDGISQNYPPQTRMYLRKARTYNEVAAAMRASRVPAGTE